MKIQLPDVQLAYSEAGQGQPVLFVHGYPLNRQMWQPQVEKLADVGHILTIDLRGHGESQAVAGPYSMDLFADDLNALLDALQIREPIVLCGLSMGGYVAFAFQRRYASRLKGLVLTATRAGADTPQARQGRDQATETARQQGAGAIVESMLPKLLAPRTLQENPELVARARAILQSTPLETILGDLAALKERPDSTPTLAEIQVPTLILPGAEDQLIPLSEAQAMHSGIASAYMEVIPRAGHLPNLENPVAFNGALANFLAAF